MAWALLITTAKVFQNLQLGNKLKFPRLYCVLFAAGTGRRRYTAIMKQQFENPELEVIELDVRDIIATSGDGEGEGEDFTS
ncbi:MAG: hypothetical protein KBT15_04370 [Bacteroidales bacterium]|nr:hypothetical protein [Candidatus Minthousia equi]